MVNHPIAPLRPRVLVVDDELAKLDTALGRAVENVAVALDARNIDVVKAVSFEDGQAIVVSDASIRALLLDWNLGHRAATQISRATSDRAGIFNRRSRAHQGHHDGRGR
jgi:hypothetical protein